MDQVNAPPQPYEAFVSALQSRFDQALGDGQISPFIFPHDFGPIFILILTLLIKIPRNGPLKFINYLSFGYISYLSILNISRVRMQSGGTGNMIGVMFTYQIVLSASLLVFNNPQRDFKRIERSTIFQRIEEVPGGSRPITKTSVVALENNGTSDNSLKLRSALDQAAEATTTSQSAPGKTQEIFTLRWQSYPDTFSHRLSWVMDLTQNLRGAGWNWRIHTAPKFPGPVSKQLDRSLRGVSKPEVTNPADTYAFTRAIISQVAVGYMALDILRVLVKIDPYFWGVVTTPPPPPLNSLGTFTNTATQAYRVLVTALAVTAAVSFQSSAMTLLTILISTYIPSIRTWTLTPIEAPWMYPPTFGPFSATLDHGLQGFWGQSWHQLFRFTFTQPGIWLTAHLPHPLRKPLIKRTIHLTTTFAISGLVHATGSYTQVPSTNPTHVFLLFILQVPAILFQTLVAEHVIPRLPFQPPRWLRRLTNLLFALAVAFFTGLLGADDFAKGGMWLVEPVPVSLVRGLGFGRVEGERWWWLWGAKWFRLWRGERWWEVGVWIL
ncbi:hypothetical protein FQN53_006576 [Emmonsiellopsis sp. PD_33]|nr:hypothetical protein FQN53_006576 [Emmonsiellopsis sp. PD_33]